MGGTIALVTGANRGIGLEIARQLAELGHTVLVGARDGDRGAAAAAGLRAAGLDATAVRLDVGDQASVDGVAEWVDRTYGRLDVLVNNAVCSDGDGSGVPAETTATQMRAAYEVNVFGPVALIHALLPLLRRSGRARIVNVSSAVGSITMSADPHSPYAAHNHLPYASSKSALNAVTVSYARALRADGILVNAVCPGPCATDLNSEGHRTAAQGARIAVAMATLPDDGPSGTFRNDEGVLPW
jgi:NAD(P)-dependent dehydrogenase (short-subunit alcohol dehydrogenase family)